VLALLIGWDLAEGSFALAVLVAVLVLLLVVNRALNLAPDLWVTGLILVGYLIGNRGFAQLHPPNLPLLPAEFALGISVLFGLWRWARERRVPYRPDTLNACVLLWLVFATLRLPLDFRATGFVAIRDFAMVYYAVFFFLAQDWSQSGENRRFLERALIGGLALTTPAFWAFSLAPEWIERHIAIAGTPLLYVKSDVAGGFMAGAVFVFVERYSVRRRAAWILLASVSLAGVATSNSRAAGVALFAGLIWLVVLRRWAAIRIVAALIAIGIVGLVGQAVVTRAPLTTTPLYRGYEAVVSIGDIHGVRTYRSAELGDKPDNNQFRTVWWETVAADTWREGRWFGLGFGHDLAEDFLRVYAPDGDEQFTARSPHNFLLSNFARMGMVGALLLFAQIAALGWKTRQSKEIVDPEAATPALAWWLLAWSILISACFGVVLEGPMAAAVFWTALGLANAKNCIGGRAKINEPGGLEAQPARLTRAA